MVLVKGTGGVGVTEPLGELWVEKCDRQKGEACKHMEVHSVKIQTIVFESDPNRCVEIIHTCHRP